LTRYFQSANLGHHEVEHEDIRLLLFDHVEDIQPAGDFAHDFQIGFSGEQSLQSMAYNVVVVGQYDLNSAHWGISRIREEAARSLFVASGWCDLLPILRLV